MESHRRGDWSHGSPCSIGALVALGEIAGLKRAISVKPAMFIW